MDIASLRQQFDATSPRRASEADLRARPRQYLSRKNGLVSAFMKTVGRARPPSSARRSGQAANELKQHIDTALDGAAARPRRARRPAGDAIDVTLPGRPPLLGHRHPLTLLRERIESIFLAHGLPDRRRARARGRLPQLRSAQHAGGASRARHAGHAVPRGAGARPRRRDGRRRCCARTRRACRSATWRRTSRRSG